MITLSEAKKLLEINTTKLDDECRFQPELYYEIAENAVKSISLRDKLKEEKDNTWSRQFIKEKVEGKLDGKTLSDKTAETFADVSAEVEKANNNYLKAKEEAEEWIALKESFQQRAAMLKELCGLFVSGYFGEISVKSNSAKEAEIKERRKKLR